MVQLPYKFGHLRALLAIFLCLFNLVSYLQVFIFRYSIRVKLCDFCSVSLDTFYFDIFHLTYVAAIFLQVMKVLFNEKSYGNILTAIDQDKVRSRESFGLLGHSLSTDLHLYPNQLLIKVFNTVLKLGWETLCR